MRITDLFRYSLKRLKAKKLETLLIVFAVTISVLVFTTILSPTYRRYKLRDDIEFYKVSVWYGRDLGANYLMNKAGLPIVPYIVPEDASNYKLTIPFLEELCKIIPGVDFYLTSLSSAYYVRGYSQQTSSIGGPIDYNAPGYFGFTHMSPEAINGLGLELKSGSLYTKDDFLNNRPYVILGNELAEKLFPGEDPVGKTVEFTSPTAPVFTVVGVFEPYPVQNNFSTLRNINQMAASAHFVLIRPNSELSYSSVDLYPKTLDLDLYKKVNTYLEKHYPGTFTVNSLASQIERADKDYDRSYFILGFIAAFILLIVCINIINLLFTQLAKQNKNIGLNIALGATKKTIFFQYFLSSLLQGLLGSSLGVILLFIISRTKIGYTFHIIFNSQAVLYGIGAGIIMSLLFGIYPALVATQVSPVEALRTD